jgi:DNA replication and repair protein RecF
VRVLNLALTNFRNYDRLDLELGPGLSVFWGDNAQGKSNLLEAVFYLATMRSFRATTDRDVIAWSAAGDPLSFTRIAARIGRDGDRFSVDVVLRETPRDDGGDVPTFSKRIKINDVPRRAIDAVGTTTAVMFSPGDIQLIDGSPGIRRRYLDVSLSQADPRYCRGLAHYNRVLLQRNHLLRAVRDRGTKLDELHFWDDELVKAGAYLIARRQASVADLAADARELYAALSRTAETLTVSYKNNAYEASGEGAPTVEAIQQAYAIRLAAIQSREARQGISLVGPHRDDILLSLDGKSVADYGSRGQQRTVALALKLAELRHLTREARELPVLLLDDVFSELDQHRRDRILGALDPKQQVLVTTADPASVGRLAASADWYHVSDGHLERQAPAEFG